MAYPDKINALVDVTADQTLAAGGHAARHNDVNDALDELEAVFTAPAANELALRPDGTNQRFHIDSAGDVTITGDISFDGGTDLSTALAGKAPTTALYLSGTSGNNVSAPDSAALDITDEIDIRLHLAMDDWTPAADFTAISKWWAGANERSYYIRIQTDGKIRFQYTNTGSAGGAAYTSSVSVSASNKSDLWIRVTWTNDNGTGNSEANFYTSSNGSTWVALGVAQTDAATDTIHSGSSPINIGSFNTSGGESACKWYRAQILDGINGTMVADWRGDVPAVRYRDEYDNNWTVNGTANAWVIV